ncbi:hypothetical protein F383_31392 [Gossypium arboreum]|uniref:Uncharacterized protein n=1 Tax=Gossypium arboreum TaxID=29729 RepID=A0A0B0PIE5_GOSAR|nr:hypothetical protein F383_31392 [Gossypium arboreum]
MNYCEVTCVVLSAGYYVYRIIGRMCSTKCRLLCVPDNLGHVCSTKCRLLRVPDNWSRV